MRFLPIRPSVVNRAAKITYAAYMPSLSEEPNYAEMLAAAPKAYSAGCV